MNILLDGVTGHRYTVPMTRRQQLLDFLAAHPWARFPEIQKHLGTTRGNASVILRHAIDDKDVAVRGQRRRYEYALSSAMRRAALANSSIFTFAQQ